MAGTPWTTAEVTYLRQKYNQLPVSEIAQNLRRSYNSVQRKAQSLKLCQPAASDRKPWTDDEIRILERNYEKSGPKAVARRLNRTEQSVKHKAQKLGLNSYLNEFVHLKALAGYFGSDPRVVHNWISKYGLPMKKRQRGGIVMYSVLTDDFWKWAEQHKDIIPFHKYELYSLLPEPAWLQEAIKTPVAAKSRTSITGYERNFVIMQRKRGLTFKEIAAKIDRTENSVKHIWRQHLKTAS